MIAWLYSEFFFSRDQRRNESRFMSFTQYQDEISNQTNQVFYGTELTFDPQAFKAHTEVSEVESKE